MGKRGGWTTLHSVEFNNCGYCIECSLDNGLIVLRMPCESFNPIRTCPTVWTLQNLGMQVLSGNFRMLLATTSHPSWLKTLIGRRRSLDCQVHRLSLAFESV